MNSWIKWYLLILLIGLSSCILNKHKYTAEEAYKSKHYALAITLFEARLSPYDDRLAEMAYKLGRSYEAVHNYPKASLWFEKASQSVKNVRFDIAYAISLMKLEQYDKAISLFTKINDSNYKEEIIRRVRMCQESKKWKKGKKSNLYKVSEVSFNSSVNDYAPSFYFEDVLFSSDRDESIGSEEYAWTGNSFSDIFVSSLTSENVEPFTIDINTSQNEGVLCFNQSHDELFFTQCSTVEKEKLFCKLMFTKLIDGFWSIPINIQFFENSVNEVHPCLIEKDEVLIFSANPPNSQGGYDLYYSVKENNEWSKALPMPNYINTIGDEMFPTSDGDSLYFSSDYLLGMGGMDIFKSYLKQDFKWSIPENLRAPINSGHDDFYLSIDPEFSANEKASQAGLFSSNRLGGAGKDDIYRFVKTIKQVEEPIELDSASSQIVAKVFVLYIISDTEGNKLSEISVFKNGRFHKSIDSKSRYFFAPKKQDIYHLLFKKSGYLNTSDFLKLSDSFFDQLIADTTISKQIVLEKYQTEKEIILDDIYYDYNKYDIREEAKLSLQRLIDLLKDNPNLKVELASHTDCRGKEDYNQELSQKRAIAAVLYIVGKGIDSKRLVPMGYGESRPIDSCECNTCSEDAYQLNRRTSFRILDK